MASFRCALLVCAAVAVPTGCSISPTLGEALADCSDIEDNDGDHLVDCMDPDCQALSQCSGVPRSMRPVMPPPGGQIEDAYVAELPDARPPALPEPPDAAMPEPPDAAEPPDSPGPVVPGCPGGCPTGQTCDGLECIDDVLVVLEHWDVTRVEIYAPRSVEEGGTPCLDTACFLPRSREPFDRCFCAPDPQVQFWVDRDPSDTEDPELAGETRPATASDEAIWSAPGVTLRLLPASEIHVKMVDDDGNTDEPMFSCAIEAAVVTGGGPIECKEPFPVGASDAVEFYIRAQVAPGQLPPE